MLNPAHPIHPPAREWFSNQLRLLFAGNPRLGEMGKARGDWLWLGCDWVARIQIWIFQSETWGDMVHLVTRPGLEHVLHPVAIWESKTSKDRIRDLRWYSFTAGHVKFIVLGARKIKKNMLRVQGMKWLSGLKIMFTIFHYTIPYLHVFTMFQMSRTNMTNRLIFCCSEAT